MFAGVLPKILETKEAIMHRTVIPRPSTMELVKQQLEQEIGRNGRDGL